jgi:hypothetical protein
MFTQTFSFMGAKWDVPDCAWVSVYVTKFSAESQNLREMTQDGKSCITPIVPKAAMKAAPTVQFNIVPLPLTTKY